MSLPSQVLPFVLAALAGPLPAAYSNLVATGDGAAVFFEVRTGVRAVGWYKAQAAGGRVELTQLERPASDVSDDGATTISTTFGERYCGFGGSTCWTAPPCQAVFAAEGPALRVEAFGRRTFARLNRGGRLVWIEQTTECRGMGTPVSPERQGLYELPGLCQIAPSGALTLASRRPGRRMITQGGQALAQAADTQLHLVDQTGARQIRHQYAATEAVIDAWGRNIVYTDGSPGRMMWLDLERRTEDDIGTGAAPALSDDGKLLAYLSTGGELFLYRRETGRHERLLDQVIEFTLAGGGRRLFAVTAENRLLRIDTETGAAEIWLEPLPEIREAYPAPENDPATCPLICYSAVEPALPLVPEGYLILGGQYWSDGWRARLAGIEIPLQVPWSEAVWFQVPAETPPGRQPLVIFHPSHPLRLSTTARISAAPVN